MNSKLSFDTFFCQITLGKTGWKGPKILTKSLFFSDIHMKNGIIFQLIKAEYVFKIVSKGPGFLWKNTNSNNWIWPQWYKTDKKERSCSNNWNATVDTTSIKPVSKYVTIPWQPTVQKYFVVHELWAVKSYFITYVFTK